MLVNAKNANVVINMLRSIDSGNFNLPGFDTHIVEAFVPLGVVEVPEQLLDFMKHWLMKSISIHESVLKDFNKQNKLGNGVLTDFVNQVNFKSNNSLLDALNNDSFSNYMVNELKSNKRLLERIKSNKHLNVLVGLYANGIVPWFENNRSKVEFEDGYRTFHSNLDINVIAKDSDTKLSIGIFGLNFNQYLFKANKNSIKEYLLVYEEFLSNAFKLALKNIKDPSCYEDAVFTYITENQLVGLNTIKLVSKNTDNRDTDFVGSCKELTFEALVTKESTLFKSDDIDIFIPSKLELVSSYLQSSPEYDKFYSEYASPLKYIYTDNPYVITLDTAISDIFINDINFGRVLTAYTNRYQILFKDNQNNIEGLEDFDKSDDEMYNSADTIRDYLANNRQKFFRIDTDAEKDSDIEELDTLFDDSDDGIFSEFNSSYFNLLRSSDVKYLNQLYKVILPIGYDLNTTFKAKYI